MVGAGWITEWLRYRYAHRPADPFCGWAPEDLPSPRVALAGRSRLAQLRWLLITSQLCCGPQGVCKWAVSKRLKSSYFWFCPACQVLDQLGCPSPGTSQRRGHPGLGTWGGKSGPDWRDRLWVAMIGLGQKGRGVTCERSRVGETKCIHVWSSFSRWQVED